ncbi:hypothetical protein TNCT_634291 [Trichonephila clavata]|uniref:Uncharacterized protein n=1 Tax=Trichonephila clavata TaxID=2740835 RepID=A0A8X6F2G3_TRICU|nr:hypothetical protein TNCT_634291 [Trichonephila clavata]
MESFGSTKNPIEAKLNVSFQRGVSVVQQINMKTALILALCVVLLLQNSIVDAQRNRRPSARDNIRGGSGGPTGIRFPTEEEDRNRRGGSGGLHAGKWTGGFYGGTKF